MNIESEKLLERKLKKTVQAKGGLCIKLSAAHFIGIPDRMCLLPGGVLVFVELKTTKEKPRKIQLYVHFQHRGLGFRVEVIDTSKQLEDIIGYI